MVTVKSILEEFALGNINPSVGSVTKGSHYDLVTKSVSESEEILMVELEGKLQEIFSKYVEAHAEANQISNTDNFIYGYRLGVLMTMEVFSGKSEGVFWREQS